MTLIEKLVAWLLRVAGVAIGTEQVEWVVNDLGELGVRIMGRCFFLYKGRSLEYRGLHDDGTPMRVRRVGKREFGESCCSPIMERVPQPSGRYTVECAVYGRNPNPWLWAAMPRRPRKEDDDASDCSG